MNTNDYLNFLKSDNYNNILKYDSFLLEDDHNFIQWIFPTTMLSTVNNQAPIINIKELRNSPEYTDARNKMKLSLKLITKHWGISDEYFDINKFQRLDGHNGLRLSRVLQSLIYHGLNEDSLELLTTVTDNIEYLNNTKMVGDLTLWKIRYDEALNEVKLCKF